MPRHDRKNDPQPVERGNRFLEYLTKNVVKIGSVLGAIVLIVGTASSLDGRWAKAADVRNVSERQLQFEERQTQQSIYDIEDRLDNPRLTEKRRGHYEERLRALKDAMKKIEAELKKLQKEGK